MYLLKAKQLAPFSRPIRNTTETDDELFPRFFPRSTPCNLINFLRDLIGFYNWLGIFSVARVKLTTLITPHSNNNHCIGESGIKSSLSRVNPSNTLAEERP